MNTLEKAARDYAGIKPDVFIDSEERYYNSHACENYDAFKAGANWVIEKACKWMEENLREVHPRTGEEVCIVNFNRFREAMEE